MSDLTKMLAENDLENPQSARDNKSYWQSVSKSGSEEDKVYANQVLASIVARTLAVLASMSKGTGTCYRCKKSVSIGSKCCGVYCMKSDSNPVKPDPTPSVEERVIKLSAGVPGAIRVLSNVPSEYWTVFEQHDITGSKIWCMFKDLCDQKINTMIELLQMLQGGTKPADLEVNGRKFVDYVK